jgi:signal transduction histidine kinase
LPQRVLCCQQARPGERRRIIPAGPHRGDARCRRRGRGAGGLGLSISYDIVTQQHGGTITVESEPGSFTEFLVRLPYHP